MEDKDKALIVDMGRISAIADILMVIACRYPEDSDIYKFVRGEVDHTLDFLKEYLERCKNEE